MPEGDTIHKVAAAMAPELEGRKLRGGRLREVPGAPLAGRIVSDVGVHGKHLFIELDNAQVLRTHLGMTGSWHRYAPGERWQRPSRQASVVLETDDDVFVCFNASETVLMRARGARHKDIAARLGPDLLGDAPDFNEILRRARVKPATMIASDLMLDQTIASGIGNVYKSEVLFIHRVHPTTAVSELDDATILELFVTAARLLKSNLGGGARVTRFCNDGAGHRWVYNRAGKPCLECETPVVHTRTGRHQRGTWHCPRCQRDRTTASV